MKAEKFIKEYLSSCDDNIVCLHAPDNCISSMFSIYELYHEPIDEANLLYYDVSQIRAEVENYHYNLAVVIHIYTEYPCEEAK